MIGILVVAAGESRRYGAIKQLVDIDGTPMLRHVVLQALATGARVTVVVGAHADAVAASISDLDVAMVRNGRWPYGMGASIALGVSSLLDREPGTSAVLLMLADQPRVMTDDLLRLMAAHRALPDRIVAADYGDGVLGAPALFPRRFHDALRALSGAGGARVLIEDHAADVARVTMPNARIDIDSPADLRMLQPSGGNEAP